ncbi:hypothetical protein ACQY0O_005936 [Thecaphora frezii]
MPAAPSLSTAAASALRRRSVPRARTYLSTCHSISRLPSASVVASSSESDSSSGSGSSPSSSSSSSSSSNNRGSSSSGNNGTGSSPSPSTSAAQASKVDLTTANGRSNGAKPTTTKNSVASANPPPSSLASVAYEAFFSNGRPLLQHEMLPPRPKHDFGPFIEPILAKAANSGSTPTTGSLTALFTGDGSLAAFGSVGAFESQSQWRRRIRSISPERFSQLVDELSGAKDAASAQEAEADGETKWLFSSFNPQSDRVALESAKLEEEERLKEEEEEAVQSALERGEDPEVARKLGIEADLIILGEPEGPRPEWSRGVATYLAEKGRAYEPPPAPQPKVDKDGKPIEASEEQSALSEMPHVASTTFFTDDDPNLILSHAMVQATLPLALKWDRLVSQMDAAALDQPEKALKEIDLTKLNAKIPSIKASRAERDAYDVSMDSVRRKRRKKIRKHKYKKLRKEQRAERQRMKK